MLSDFPSLGCLQPGLRHQQPQPVPGGGDHQGDGEEVPGGGELPPGGELQSPGWRITITGPGLSRQCQVNHLSSS